MKKGNKDTLKIIEKKFNEALQIKISRYKRETKYMPFMDAILGKENTRLYSFGISMATWMGQSSNSGYETIAKILAESAGSKVYTQYEIPYTLTKETDSKIYDFYMSIRSRKMVPKSDQLQKEIKKFAQSVEGIDNDRIVDVFIIDKDNNHYFIDITSPKSNMKEASSLKLKLMRWTAIGLSGYKAKKVYAFVAFPYNPNHPKPYKRFSTDIFDENNDILIQENFWNKISGFEVYDELIKIINKVGKKNVKAIKSKIEKLSMQ